MSLSIDLTDVQVPLHPSVKELDMARVEKYQLSGTALVGFILCGATLSMIHCISLMRESFSALASALPQKTLELEYLP